MTLHLTWRGWDECKALLFGQFAQQACLGFQNFGFITFESFLHIFETVAQQPVKQLRQLARQRHVGRQTAKPAASSTS